jgi:hypothetical protein
VAKSSGGEASMMPVTPPIRKANRKPIENSIGGLEGELARHMVPIQLKNLTPVGTAIRSVMNEKNGSSTAPVVNMWCAHTPVDRAAMAMVAKTMPL